MFQTREKKMSVVLERVESIKAAIHRLRTSPLEKAKEPKILIYKSATIRMSHFYPEELNLTSLYVLKDRLERLRILRQELLDGYQIDILKLDNVLHLRTSDGNRSIMAPPFVEIYEEKVQVIGREQDRQPPGVQTLKLVILKDGIHRAWIAREAGVEMRCLTVSGALREYLPYAYPNSWDDVKEYDDVPSLKKHYRRHDPYSDMRPLKAMRGETKAEWGR